MNKQAFSIYDMKTQSFDTPFFDVNIMKAQQAVAAVCLDPNSMLARYPEDFALYEIGEFDTGKGCMIPAAMPINLGTLGSIVAAMRPAPVEAINVEG